MERSSFDHENDLSLKCPECKHPLKRRRSRNPDKCEIVCGGCGQSFDICDLETRDRLKPN